MMYIKVVLDNRLNNQELKYEILVGVSYAATTEDLKLRLAKFTGHANASHWS